MDKTALIPASGTLLTATALLAAKDAAKGKPEGPKAARLGIVLWDDPILSRESPPIPPEKFGEGLLELGNRMLASFGSDGIGLAAPQVGISMRLFVIDVEKIERDKGGGTIIAVNPTVVSFGGYETQDEECLSLPGISVPVTRQGQCTLAYQDPLTGEIKASEFSGLTARCVQHENDHLLGKLIIHTTTRHYRRAALKQLEAQNTRRPSYKT